MIGYFSPPIDDELFFSAAARHGSVMDYSTPHSLSQALFGKDRFVERIDFPYHLGAFVRRLPPGAPLELKALIDNHSLLPYYAPFLDADVCAAARLAMEGAWPRGLHARLGLMQSRGGRRTGLRLCPVCAENDLKAYGFMAWKRVHQLPGVYLCPVHHLPLRESPQTDFSRGNPAYVTLTPDIVATSAPVDAPLGSDFLLFVAKSSDWLLRNPGPPIAREALHARLLALIARKGYRLGRRVRREALRNLALDRYGIAGLAFLGFPVRDKHRKDSISVLTNSQRAIRPLSCIVLLHLLDAEISELLVHADEGFHVSPSNRTPDGTRERRRARGQMLSAPTAAPCANPVCHAYKKAPLDRLSRLRLAPGQHQIECSICEFRYRWTPASPKWKTVVNTGPLWDAALKRLLRDPAVSAKGAAKCLGMSAHTIKAHAIRLGVGRREWKLGKRCVPAITLPEKLRAVLARHRARLLRIRRANPRFTRTDFLRAAGNTWDYLALYDHEWLMRHVPPRSRARSAVDWAARDRDLTARARAFVAATLAAAGRPTRITVYLVLRSVGAARYTYPTAVAQKLPMLWAYLCSVRENNLLYWRRRLAWGVTRVSTGEWPNTRHGLMKAAQLWPKAMELLGAEVDEALANVICPPTLTFSSRRSTLP